MQHRGVSGGRTILTVEPEAITELTKQAFHDISHLLRPGHLAQLPELLRLRMPPQGLPEIGPGSDGDGHRTMIQLSLQ